MDILKVLVVLLINLYLLLVVIVESSYFLGKKGFLIVLGSGIFESDFFLI